MTQDRRDDPPRTLTGTGARQRCTHDVVDTDGRCAYCHTLTRKEDQPDE